MENNLHITRTSINITLWFTNSKSGISCSSKYQRRDDGRQPWSTWVIVVNWDERQANMNWASVLIQSLVKFLQWYQRTENSKVINMNIINIRNNSMKILILLTVPTVLASKITLLSFCLVLGTWKSAVSGMRTTHQIAENHGQTDMSSMLDAFY